MCRMLDINKLALLREVFVHGGVTRAAEALQMSTSNVSQQIRRFEREIGVSLLTSEGRGVRLTPAAERLVERAEAILELISEAETDIDSLRDDAGGTVRLAGFHTFAVGLLGSVVRHLEVIAPTLTLEYVQLDPEAATNEVLARRADIAVVDEYRGYATPPIAGLVRAPIGEEPIHVYLPAGEPNPSSAPWAMEPLRSDAAKWAIGICREAGFEPRVRFSSPDPYVHRRLVEEGVAAGFLPAIVARGFPESIRPSELLPGSLSRTYALLARRGTLRSPAIRACHAAIVSAFNEALPDERSAQPGQGA